MTDMNGKTLVRGDVVQINPGSDETFGGCFMVVDEVKSWGVQGYVDVPGRGRAYYRCATEAMVWVGTAEWVADEEVS